MIGRHAKQFSAQCSPDIAFFEGSQASPTCISDNSVIKMNTSKAYWWYNTEEGKTEVHGEKPRSQRGREMGRQTNGWM
jgi:hypothetical protein